MNDWVTEFRNDPRHSGIFLDFDGTISDIAPSPRGAVLHPRAADLLPRLARHYPLCVLSGRRVADVASLVGLPHIHYVGVHGMEWLEGDEPRLDPEVLPYLPALDRARAEIREILPGLPGVILEDKMASLTLHFREAPHSEEQVVHLGESLALRLGLGLKRGRKSVEIRPPVEIDKGTVIIRLSRGWKLRRGLFAGDDLTDVDGFRGLRYLMREGGFEGVAVAVLSGETPVELEAVADLSVRGPEGLLELLSRLAVD
ncbi:trehalose-phosphatase [Candidatus Solincola tengchongensis]|uniref:trehalose-phosphatase n=1 Tax=Candidatus Solincola tengchongensis TaxID=2900693 RepID=UPI00257D1DB6|nr:trehalose-phosphatase [Candidatus Solincola tengchongensis]